jgi:hypothetical protein
VYTVIYICDDVYLFQDFFIMTVLTTLSKGSYVYHDNIVTVKQVARIISYINEYIL